jgi:quaternary ammonium compound-resistance protein SugE
MAGLQGQRGTFNMRVVFARAARFCAHVVFNGGPMAWILLFVAGLLEVVWAFSMKLSQGFTRPLSSVVTIAAMIASFALLSMSMRTLPLGTAYTVWTGIGAAGAFLLGIVALGEPANLLRVIAGLLIITGIVLMKVSAT